MITEHRKNLIYMGLIVFATFLVYAHNLFPKDGAEPELCYNTTRFIVYSYGKNLMALVIWIMLYMHTKGKAYRFVIWLPICTILYQYIVYMTNLRDSFFNEITIKVALTFLAVIAMAIHYFNRKNAEKLGTN